MFDNNCIREDGTRQKQIGQLCQSTLSYVILVICTQRVTIASSPHDCYLELWCVCVCVCVSVLNVSLYIL